VKPDRSYSAVSVAVALLFAAFGVGALVAVQFLIGVATKAIP
jgi:hypothetical protein